MRKLTITRQKSFVACLAKIQVYIEDTSSSELVINGTPCKKLGVIKNGETISFEIENCATKIFVIADKVSRNYCNEVYEIPEGEEDVSLVGKNEYNPISGNAFRFQNNNSEIAQSNRKKGTKVGIVVLIAACIVGFVIGLLLVSPLFDEKPEPLEFSASGMNITLTEDFEKNEENMQYTAVFESQKVIVLALKENFSILPGSKNMTLEEYGELVLSVNKLTDAELKEVEGLLSFEYDATSDREYHYLCFVYKASDAFWLLQFATVKSVADEHRADIIEYAKTVDFDK